MNAAKRPVIGLTGGIATGKSTVSQRFAARGIGIYDADQAAREVIRPGSEGLIQLVETFGPTVLDTHGQLNRPLMRQRIFADPKARLAMENIVHPHVQTWLQQYVLSDTGPYCLLVIPLLVEHRVNYLWITRLALVDVDETVQLRRLLARDGIDETLARRMMASQASRQQRLAAADDVINNHGALATLDAQVAALHARYLTWATHDRRSGP